MTAKPLGVHPAADLFPMLSEDELRSLAADIKANGLRQPIVTTEEDGERLILDGRNRYRACAIAGIEPKFIAFGGDDPFALVVSANLHRRHLTTSQRAMVADSLAKLRHGGDRASKASKEALVDESASQRDAAALLRVSRPSVQRARRVRERGVPELVEAVVAGKIAVAAAGDLAKLPHEDQRRMLGAGAKQVTCSAVERARARPVATVEPEPVKAPRGRPAFDERHRLVRELTEQGCTAFEIAQQTGIKRSFVNHSRSICKPKSVLEGVIVDTEVFAEFWARRGDHIHPKWAAAPRKEIQALIDALYACRTAAAKAINRLKKEIAEGTDHEAHQTEAH